MATRDEIEAQIAAKPYADDAYLILGDLLQLAGDPRGELIALDAAALRAGPGEHAVVRKQRAELLARHPVLAPDAPSHGYELTWHLGFVRKVRVIKDEPDRRSVFRHPSMQFATELDIYGEGLTEAWIAELTAWLPLLRRLTIGTRSRYWVRSDDIYDLDRCLHHLDQLEWLATGRTLRLTRAPALRELELTNVTRTAAEWLAKAELPSLERLSLDVQAPRLSTPAMTVDDASVLGLDDLQWLLATPPRDLAELELIDLTFGDAFVTALRGSPLLGQLRVLRLWNAGLTLEGARAITRDAFGHLELFDLSDPTLDDDVIDAVAGTAREVRTIGPRVRDLLRRDGYGPSA